MDDPVEPRRSRDELLEVVVERGEAIRLRRRRLFGGAAGAVVLVVALVAGVVTAQDRADDTKVASVGSRPTTTVARSGLSFGAARAGENDGGSLFAFPAARVPAASVNAESNAGAPAPSAPAPKDGRSGAGVPAPAPAPAGHTAAAVATTTSVPAGVASALRECTPERVTVSATTDKPAYGPGEKVVLTSRATNSSSEPCFITGYTFEVSFTDATGKPVTALPAMVADYFRQEPFSPGETLTETREWDQQACTAPDGSPGSCAAASPGPYQGNVRWLLAGGPHEASAKFALVAVAVPVP